MHITQDYTDNLLTNLPMTIEQDEPRAGGTLVDRTYVTHDRKIY